MIASIPIGIIAGAGGGWLLLNPLHRKISGLSFEMVTFLGILVLDLEGKCILANTAGARYLGYDDTSGLLGKSTHELIHHTKASGEAYAET